MATGICDDLSEAVRPDADPNAADADPNAADADPNAADAAAGGPISIDQDVAPVLVSGGLACSTGSSNLDRNIAIDASNRIYVAFECGGTLHAAVSADGGQSYSAPVALGIGGVDSIAVAGGPTGDALVAIGASSGIELAVTTNGGQTWSSRNLSATSGNSGWGISLAVAGDSVYVAREVSGTTRVFSNHQLGVGAFDTVDVTLNTAYGDIAADPVTGDVFVVGDTPSLHVRRSTDGGLTFSTETTPSGSYHYSDWTLSDATIFVAGEETTFSQIPVADPTTSTQSGSVLNQAANRGRAISTAADGTLFAVQIDDTSGELSLTYLPSGAGSASTMSLPSGEGGSVVAASSTAVVYSFSNSSSEVLAGVEMF